MQVRHSPQDYSKALHWNDFATSLYLPLFITYLYHNGFLLVFGNFSNIHNISFLAGLEVTKYIFYTSSNKTTIYKHAKDIIKSFLVILAFFVATYLVIVIFGAAAFSNIQETTMLTMLITTLTALPICLHFGAENAITMFLSLVSFGGTEIQNLFMVKLRLSLLGAWLGAIVIPLDWNRPWQNWPIPCCFGALCGYTVATWLCLGLQYYRWSKWGRKTGKYAL